MKRSHTARLSPRRHAAIRRKEFRLLLAAYPELRYEWDHILGSGVSGDWTIAGGDGSAEVRFKDIAERAASLLPGAGDIDPLVAWLEVLRLEGTNFRYGRETAEGDSDGIERVRHLHGTLLRVCEASANYCSVLESRALAEHRAQQGAEFREKQQNAPQSDATKASAIAHNPPSAAMVAEEGITPRTTVTIHGKRGPKRDFETAMKVDEVITRLAPDGNWRAQLEAVCEGLDEALVRRPKPWKAKGYRAWYDCMTDERALVIKAIEHHRERAQEYKKTFS